MVGHRITSAEDRCYACQGEDNPDLMLVCDHCNVKVCHLSCLRPRLTEIPYAEWYCDYCVQTFNIRSLLPTARIFDTNRNRRRRQAEVRPPSRRRRLVRNPEPEEDQESSVEPEPPARSPSPEPVNNQRRNPRRNARNNYQPVMQNTAPRGNSRRNQNQNIQQVVQENPRTALQRNRRIFNQTIERTIRTPDDLIVRNQNAFEEEFTGLNIRRRVIDENML
jgi:hypothetical protein